MSAPEDTLALHIRINEFPAPEREYRFRPPRRWRFDFAWPAQKLAVEVEGGIYRGGRHTSIAGFTGDCEKYNEAALDGWRVLRVTPAQVDSGAAIDWLRRALVPQGVEAAPF